MKDAGSRLQAVQFIFLKHRLSDAFIIGDGKLIADGCESSENRIGYKVSCSSSEQHLYSCNSKADSKGYVAEDRCKLTARDLHASGRNTGLCIGRLCVQVGQAVFAQNNMYGIECFGMSSQLAVEDCTFQANGQHAASTMGSTQIDVKRCRSSGPSKSGFHEIDKSRTMVCLSLVHCSGRVFCNTRSLFSETGAWF